MSFTAHKRRREKTLRKCSAMRAAKARRHAERAAECGSWERVATVLLHVTAAPDGRTIGIRYADGRGEWHRCGSERAVMGALRSVIYGRRLAGAYGNAMREAAR